MPQIGTIQLDGISVPYFEIGDVTGERIRVQDANGQKGAINLLPRADAAHPTLTFQHPQTGALYAPHDRVYYKIDDFERGNLAPYREELYTNEYYVNSGAAYQGQYGLDANHTGSIYSLPGDGLNHYFDRGETLQMHFRVDRNQSANYINKFRLNFGIQDPAGSGSLDNLYEITLFTESEAESSLRFDKQIEGQDTIILGYGAPEPYPEVGRWEVIRLQWDADDTFHFEWETADGQITRDEWTYQDTNSIDYGNGGIGLLTTEALEISFDELQTIAPIA